MPSPTSPGSFIQVLMRAVDWVLTSGKPYWRDFGAKFGHFVGDVEAKSGYGIGL